MTQTIDTDQGAKRPPGRPRRVDPNVALDRAMRLFWADGYNATTVDTLCRRSGIPRATLYQSFGGKEGLFIAAIDHYVATRSQPVAVKLGPNKSLEEDLRAFFDAVVALATSDERARGCLITSVLSEAAVTNPRLRAELDRRFAGLEQRILRRLHAADEDLPAPREQTAMLIATVARGLIVRARSGADADTLRDTAETAISVITRAG